MKKALLLLSLTVILLCGCKESSIQTYQPPINVETSVINEESAVKKTTKASSKTSTKSTKNATTTTTTAPKTNTSTIKDLIIDGNGNLVATKSNNTFAIIGNVQGEKGAKGDKGEQGSQGEKGDKGDAGRGIESVDLDSEGNLIIVYTDGSTHNAGKLSSSGITPSEPYFEKEGFVVPLSDRVLPYKETHIPVYSADEHGGNKTFLGKYCSIVLTSIEMKLVGKENGKYHYIVNSTYSIDDFDTSQYDSYDFIPIDFDIRIYNNEVFKGGVCYHETNRLLIFPYPITKLSIPSHDTGELWIN